MNPPSTAPKPIIDYALVAANAMKTCGGDAALVIVFHESQGAAVTPACEDEKLRERIPDVLRRIALEMDSETGIDFKHVCTLKKGT